VIWVERLLTVEFGPSRSKRFAKAVAQAQNGPGECTEVEPGRYRVKFLLGTDAAIHSGFARLLERIRHWRATDVYEGDELVSTFHTKEMAWCAAFYLSTFGECRERFLYGVLPRCGYCPLFDSERAIRAGIREEPAVGDPQADSRRYELLPEPDFTIVTNLDFLFNPDLLTQLDGQLPDWIDLSPLIPDFPPEDGAEPGGQTAPG
jgi:hypothetical protein